MTAKEMAERLRDAARQASDPACPMHPRETRRELIALQEWAASAAETLDPLRGIGFGTDCGCRMCAATRRIDPLLAELAKLLEK